MRADLAGAANVFQFVTTPRWCYDGTHVRLAAPTSTFGTQLRTGLDAAIVGALAQFALEFQYTGETSNSTRALTNGGLVVVTSGKFDVCVDWAQAFSLAGFLFPVQALFVRITQTRLWQLLPPNVRERIIGAAFDAARRAVVGPIRAVFRRFGPEAVETMSFWYDAILNSLLGNVLSGSLPTSTCVEAWEPHVEVRLDPNGLVSPSFSGPSALAILPHWAP